MLRLVERVLEYMKARCSYSTRVWTALFFPVAAGTLFHWSTRMKLEGFIFGVLIVVAYSVAQWVEKNYLR